MNTWKDSIHGETTCNARKRCATCMRSLANTVVQLFCPASEGSCFRCLVLTGSPWITGKISWGLLFHCSSASQYVPASTRKSAPPSFVAGLCMQHVSFDWTDSCVLLSSRPTTVVHSLAMPRLGLPSDFFKHVFSSHNSRVHDYTMADTEANQLFSSFVQRRCPRKIAKLSMWCEMPGSGLEDFHQSEWERSRDDWWKSRLSVLQSAALRANTM